MPKSSCGSCASIFGELLGIQHMALVKQMKILSCFVMSGCSYVDVYGAGVSKCRPME